MLTDKFGQPTKCDPCPSCGADLEPGHICPAAIRYPKKEDAWRRIEVLESGLLWFVKRVETGEVQSRRSYRAFKELLGQQLNSAVYQKNRVYESMTKHIIGPWAIRVWYTEQVFTGLPRREIISALNLMYSKTRVEGNPVTLKDVAEVLDTFEDIAAYEILDPTGSGALVYPDWH